MSDVRRMCFDIDGDDLISLEKMASWRDLTLSEYLQDIVSNHLRDAGQKEKLRAAHEKRACPRRQVSILGVSCVKFSDNEMRSYPITVEDISEGGIRISFRSVDTDLVDKLAFADYFEVVFTVPNTTHTVSFYCKRMWASSQSGLNLAGCFEGANESSVDLVSRKIIAAA